MPTINKADGTIDNLPVRDAKFSTTLKIHKTDVRTGKIKNPDECVVARACRRALDAREVKVHINRVYVRTNKEPKVWTRYVVPASMKQEIVAFDRGGKFEAGEFKLRAPSPSQTQQGQKARAAKARKNKAAELAHAAKRPTTEKGRAKVAAKKPKRFVHMTKNVRIAA